MLTVGEPLEAAGVAVIANVVVPVTVTGSAPLCEVAVVWLPRYFAMIECVPIARPLLVIGANPPDTVTGVPSLWLSSTTPSYS
jgi:hypothetical protein